MFTSAFQALGASGGALAVHSALRERPAAAAAQLRICGDRRKRAGITLITCMDSAVWQTSTQAVSTGPGVCFLHKHVEDTDSYQITGILGVERPFLPSQFLPRWQVPGNSHPVQRSFSWLEFSGSAVRPDLRP